VSLCGLFCRGLRPAGSGPARPSGVTIIASIWFCLLLYKINRIIIIINISISARCDVFAARNVLLNYLLQYVIIVNSLIELLLLIFNGIIAIIIFIIAVIFIICIIIIIAIQTALLCNLFANFVFCFRVLSLLVKNKKEIITIIIDLHESLIALAGMYIYIYIYIYIFPSLHNDVTIVKHT
jgi:hypothetical protein